MIRVRVPATSANLGPGFDAVGIALDLYNDFYVIEGKNKKALEGCNLLGTGSLCHRAVSLLAKREGKNVPELNFFIKANVPRSRGLGSSATLTVAGLTAANEVLGTGLSIDKMLALASEIEGHPDNAAPALMGGFVTTINTEDGVKYLRFVPAQPLQFVVLVPDFELATSTARKVLPKEIPHKHAVNNTGRFGFFLASIITGDYSALRFAMEDYLHQPYRMPLVPGLEEVMGAALKAGALGSCLSGAGPSILALCGASAVDVGRSMQEAWSKKGMKTEIYILNLETTGTVLDSM